MPDFSRSLSRKNFHVLLIDQTAERFEKPFQCYKYVYLKRLFGKRGSWITYRDTIEHKSLAKSISLYFLSYKGKYTGHKVFLGENKRRENTWGDAVAGKIKLLPLTYNYTHESCFTPIHATNFLLTTSWRVFVSLSSWYKKFIHFPVY